MEVIATLRKDQHVDRSIIAGIDEAGRGPLAGPVVAAACILPEKQNIPAFIRDSKKTTPEEREEAYHWICKHCAFGIGLSGASWIDEKGILSATERAMQAAVRMLALRVRPTYLLVDGRDHFWFDYPVTRITKGDDLEPCISAASIVAKVTRDRIMEREAERFPEYGFEAHKGYGTALHYDALKSRGPCVIHRQSFLHLTPAASDAPRGKQGQRRG